MPTTLSQIGLVYHTLSDYKTARVYYEQALRILEGGDDRVGASMTYYNLAVLHRCVGNLVQARLQLNRAVELIEPLAQQKELQLFCETVQQVLRQINS